MTSPTPPPPGTLHQTQKKGVSKSAAKQQRAKQQQQQADAAAAVGAAATAVVASKQQQAGYCASDQEQARLDSHRSDASTQHQQAAADLSAVEDTPARERPLYQTAKPSAEASVHDLPAASGNSQSCSRADAQTAPRATPPSRLTEPSTDPVPSSEQATAPDCTHHQHSDSQATKPIPVHSSSSDSSISNLASRPAGDTLLLKPNRPQPPEPTATPPTSSVSSQASDLPLQDNPALLQHHPDLLQTSSPNPHSSAQSPSRFTNGSGIGLGSGGDKGKRGAGPQAEGVLAKRPVAPVSSSDGGRRPAKLLGSLKLSKRAVCFPSIGATAALVHAFAIADDIEQCFR